MPFFPELPRQIIPNGAVMMDAFEQSRQRGTQNELLNMQMQQRRDEIERDKATQNAMAQYFQGQSGVSPGLADVARANPDAAFKLQQHEALMDKAKQEKFKDAVEFGMSLLPMVEPELYPAFRADLVARGVPEHMLPARFESTEQFADWKRRVPGATKQLLDQYGITLKQLEIQDKIAERDKPSFHSYQQGDEMVTEEYTKTDGRRVIGRGLKRPDVETRIDMRQEGEEGKRWGAYLVDKDYGTIDERAKAAEQLIPQFEIARNIDIESGRFEPLKASVNAVIEGLGFDSKTYGLEQADNAQSLTGVLQNVVLTKMQAQKGPQTENDAKRIEQTVASLKNTPEAFRFLLNSAQALEERAVEQRDFYLAYKERTGSFNGAAQEWNRYKRSTPLIGKSPEGGRPVFYNEFRRVMADQYPDYSEDQILAIWRSVYAKTR